MKRTLMLMMLLSLLLLAGCRSTPDPTAKMVQPFSFYYRTEQAEFSGPDGVICPEVRDLGEESYTEQEIFRLYLEGPQSDELLSPVPKGCELIEVSRSGSVLTLSFRQAYDALTGIDQSIADACLLKTAVQLEGIKQVQFRVQSTGGQILRDVTLSESDLLLYDSGETPLGTELFLYLADTNGKYLRPEKRLIPAMNQTASAQYIIDQLLTEPEIAGLRSPLPQGTALLDINVDQGLCSVDFNADFFANRPSDPREELLTIFSIVNSLCELDDVDQVQFYVEGRRQSRYVWLDLSRPFTMDPSVVGPVREEMNEFEAALCLPRRSDPLLYQLPVRLRVKGGGSKEDAVMAELFSRPSQNGLANPLAGVAHPVSVTTSGTVCTVVFEPGILTELDEENREASMRSIVASLCSLPGISTVRILEGETDLLGTDVSPDPEWFCYSAED